MKCPKLRVLVLLGCFAATTAFAGSNPQFDVTVTTDPGGSVVYQGQADARGAFTASNLTPGKYIVQFHARKASSLKGQRLAIAVRGKERVVANDVAGDKFGGAGVAMKVQVGKDAKLTGQISRPAATVASAQGMEKVRANVKIMNGKRYIWVPGGIESNIGGRWVEEGSEAARLSTSNRKGEDGEFLRRVQDQAGNSGVQPDGFGLPAAATGP